VAKQVDAQDLKSCELITHAGSIPAPGTNEKNDPDFGQDFFGMMGMPLL
jgi:hypothetical protein